MTEVQTLARGLHILELLAETELGLTTTELATKLQVDKGGMSRLMHTLVNYRFAERDEKTRRYHLGMRVQELGRQAGQHASLRELSTPYLQQLGAATGENAHVAVYAPPQALIIADVPSTASLRVVGEVGRRTPLHCSAIGKCLLAFCEIPLPDTYTRFTKRTLTDAVQLSHALEDVRHKRYAVDDEELTLGVRGIATSIRNREGRTIATMGLSGPSVRLTHETIPQLARLLIDVAQGVSAELGYTS
ncbi:MAG: IclR family transcriptional regulator [Candidatus Promineifilaceae bacterium]